MRYIVRTSDDKLHIWSVEEILEIVNEDHSEEFQPYTNADWQEGVEEWTDLEIIGRIPEEDVHKMIASYINYHEDDKNFKVPPQRVIVFQDHDTGRTQAEDFDYVVGYIMSCKSEFQEDTETTINTEFDITEDVMNQCAYRFIKQMYHLPEDEFSYCGVIKSSEWNFVTNFMAMQNCNLKSWKKFSTYPLEADGYQLQVKYIEEENKQDLKEPYYIKDRRAYVVLTDTLTGVEVTKVAINPHDMHRSNYNEHALAVMELCCAINDHRGA